MAFTLNRRLAQLVDSNGQLNTGKIPNDYITSDHIADNTITSAMLHTSFTVSTSNLTAIDTDDVSEGSTNLYYTDARVGTYISGNRDYGNITTTGYIAGPATFTIDPAAVGDNTGTVVIAGNLQVDGTTTTINSTTMEVDDLNITLASGAANAIFKSGAGITVDGASATLLYQSTPDAWSFNKNVGIGTTNPLALLTISNSGGPGFEFSPGVTNFGVANTNYIASYDRSASTYRDISFDMGGTESNAIRFQTGGKVGIGTASPANALEISTDGTDQLNLNRADASINTNNTLAGIVVSADDPTANRSGAKIGFTAGDNWTTNYFPTNIIFSNDASGTMTERMRIDSDGNVGIGTGTTSPVGKLSISDSGATGVEFSPDDSNARVQQLYYDRVDNAYRTSLSDAGDYQFRISGIERMRIDSSGNVSIGTGSQTNNGDANLTIREGNAFAGFDFKSTRASGNIGGLRFYNTSSDSVPESQLLVETDGSYNFYNGSNGAQNRLKIDASGNVGIGGSPTNYSDHKTLSLYGNTGTGAGFIEFNDTSGNADAVIFSDNGNLFINADYDNTTADSSIRFRVDGSSEKMRIFSNGRVKIGTSFAGCNAGLHVANADIRCTAPAIANDANSISMSYESVGGVIAVRGPSTSTRGSLHLSVNQSNGGGGRVGFKIDNLGLIYAEYMGSGGATTDVNYNTSTGEIYQVTSSQRYKENISEYTDSILEKVNNLTVKNFDYKEGGYTNQIGLIAEEVEEQIPYLVNKKEIEGYDEPQPDSVKYSQLSVFLLKAIQELKTELDAAKARITELEG